LSSPGAGGRAFAAGTDISSFSDIREASDALAYEQRINEVLDAVERCPVPTIAAIAGACTGGGAAIAAACDLRIATRDLKFGFPIARTLGNCLSTASLARLVALIGAGRTREILLTARLIGAEEAHAIGLVCESVDDFAAVQTRAVELAQTAGRPCAADHPGDEGGAAPLAAARGGGRRPRPDHAMLHERRFPRRPGRVPGEAPAGVEGALKRVTGVMTEEDFRTALRLLNERKLKGWLRAGSGGLWHA
jgi:enoyl-CoA hydratase/carnithine racemase